MVLLELLWSDYLNLKKKESLKGSVFLMQKCGVFHPHRCVHTGGFASVLGPGREVDLPVLLFPMTLILMKIAAHD